MERSPGCEDLPEVPVPNRDLCYPESDRPFLLLQAASPVFLHFTSSAAWEGGVGQSF